MSPNPLDMSGRKILVTGASSGIGRGTAVYLSRLGAGLVITGRDEQRLAQTYRQLEGSGHQMICCDLSETEDLTGFFEEITRDGNKLTGLVHSAGIAPVQPLPLLTRQYLNACMNINYYSFIELVRQYAKKKNNDGGSIVGISSIFAVDGAKCQTAYCASKAAMNISVTSLALELAKKHIRINAVMPGSVMTDMATGTVELLGNEDHANQVVQRQLLGVAEPEDIGAVCAFLLSDLSKVITGRVIYADGGLIG